MKDGAYQRVGDYEILDHLGAGGMGDVYKVQHVISGRIEAMKLIRRELLGNKLAEERFLREIRVLADLNHPNIARLLTATEIDGSVAMIMEFIEGSTVERLLKEGPLSVEETNYYVSQMLSALAYAHGRNVVHRDIKPANCMVTIDEGLVKLMDFGLARSSTQRKLSEDGSASGTFDYMPPEQIAGGKVDARTDLYALGVTMFEMVTGEVLFSHSDGVGAIINAHQTEQPRAPIAVVPSIPPRLNDVILKLLEKKPEDRYQSAGEVLEALNGVSGKITPSRAADKVRRTTEIDAMVQQINGGSPHVGGPKGRTPTSDIRSGNPAKGQEGRGFTEDIRNKQAPPPGPLPPPPPRTPWAGIVLGGVVAVGAVGGSVYGVMNHVKGKSVPTGGQPPSIVSPVVIDPPKKTGPQSSQDLDATKRNKEATERAARDRLIQSQEHGRDIARNEKPPIVITHPEGGEGPTTGRTGILPPSSGNVPPIKPTLTPDQQVKLSQVKMQLTNMSGDIGAVKERIANMRQMQATQGVVMRSDVTSHQITMTSNLNQAEAAIRAGNPDEAATYANNAQDALNFLKHWAGMQ